MKNIEKFPYREVIPGANIQPVLEVEVENVGKIMCLIDSGADYTTFPMVIGRVAGVDFKKARISSSECAHGHKSVSYIAPLKIKIKDEEFIIPVNFIKDGCEPALLGRREFFDRFEITFDESSREVIFKKKKADS